MLTKSDVLDRVLDPLKKKMSEELARGVLSLDFPDSDHKRYQALSLKAQKGTLTEAEAAELDWYLSINNFMTILKAKARMSLKRRNPAA